MNERNEDANSDDPGDARHGVSRRLFLQSSAGAAAGLTAVALPAQPAPPTDAPPLAAGSAPATARSATQRTVRLRVNGSVRELDIEARVTLLDALRENLALYGTKKGCDRGQCGACTVLVDGRRINSCLTLAVMHEGAEITTIEGLGTPAALHPMQAAFLVNDAFQCGYCTPGQICSAVAAVGELKAGSLSAVTFMAAPGTSTPKVTLSDDEIKERMSGNLCRCGAYTNIVAAVRSMAAGSA